MGITLMVGSLELWVLEFSGQSPTINEIGSYYGEILVEKTPN